MRHCVDDLSLRDYIAATLNLSTLFYDWSQWYRRLIWFVVLCILLCLTDQLEMTLFQNTLNHLFAQLCRSEISCFFSFLAHHRFITAQLICNSIMILTENFQLAKLWLLSWCFTQSMKEMSHFSWWWLERLTYLPDHTDRDCISAVIWAWR